MIGLLNIYKSVFYNLVYQGALTQNTSARVKSKNNLLVAPTDAAPFLFTIITQLSAACAHLEENVTNNIKLVGGTLAQNGCEKNVV